MRVYTYMMLKEDDFHSIERRLKSQDYIDIYLQGEDMLQEEVAEEMMMMVMMMVETMTEKVMKKVNNGIYHFTYKEREDTEGIEDYKEE